MENPLVKSVGLTFAVVIAAFAVRAFWIGHPVLWNDELFTIVYARESYDYLVSLTRSSDIHPPLFYLVVKGVAELFGEGDGTGLRLISASAAALSVGLLFLFVRPRFGLGVALLAALFFVFLPVSVHYGRELRTYAFLALSLLAAILCFIQALSDDRSRRERRMFAAGYMAALAVSFHLHYSAAVYFVLFGAASLAVWGIDRDAGKVRMAMGATVLAGILCLPQAFHFVWARTQVTGDFWIAPTTLRTFYSVSLGAYPFPAWAKPVVYLLYLFGAWQLWQLDRKVAAVAFCFLVGGPLLVALIGVFTPAYLVRTIQAFTVLSPLLLALAVCALPRLARAPVVAALAAVHVVAILPSYPSEKQPLAVDEITALFGDTRPDVVYYHAPLARQFDVRGVSTDGWHTVRLEDRGGLDEIETRLSSCSVTLPCRSIAVVMERAPRFQKEDGRIWMERMDALAAEHGADLDTDRSGMRVLLFE
ncbi:phospholipid carrier-dependent glycosyltransferase [Rhodovulum sp. 12E13]|uniref:glycosyltransferase family 39 protein n=1 Tax=Rhodovulum sp. 12E13 TaxID=2203891 RepID=UPI000E19523D|nr:glycosyltransferase family 39 protein [Rhodovulum sp. 12E13]RDC74117.1 phospholipid carrier-dependent glycosyltransferase [Rhodovulum sp. 12E13]